MSQTTTCERADHEGGHLLARGEAGYGRRGELAFKIGPREVGHLHGDHAAHFMFSGDLGTALKAEGRVGDHPVFPGKPGPAARRIEARTTCAR